jgi:hypothetical protein
MLVTVSKHDCIKNIYIVYFIIILQETNNLLIIRNIKFIINFIVELNPPTRSTLLMPKKNMLL